jgi:hypothetical protein
MELEAFKQLNLAALYFDNTEWRKECKRADQATMPTQRVNPPCKATPSHRLQAWTWSRSSNRNARSETPETHAAATSARGSTARIT